MMLNGLLVILKNQKRKTKLWLEPQKERGKVLLLVAVYIRKESYSFQTVSHTLELEVECYY